MVDEVDADEVALARERLLRGLVSLARSLRRRGAEVSADATLTGAQALAVVGVTDRERVRAALRAALVSRREDLELFEALFPAFWREVADEGGEELPGGLDEELLLPDRGAPIDRTSGDGEPPADEDGIGLETRLALDGADERAREPEGDAGETAVYSPTGRPAPLEVPRGIASVDDELAGPVRDLTSALAGLRGRRWTTSGDTRPDVRRALRRSVETGGTVIDLPGRERRDTAVRAVLLVDVSRSVLDTVDRGFLVSFVRAVTEAWRDVAVFFFDTSVQEVSEAFDAPTPGAAFAALEAAETAWGGGTRIGHAIETVRREHPMLIGRDTVVLVISDGLEVGEIDVLERETAWLSRRSAAVLWANPLAGAERYEPTCRGMAAALPYLDGLFAFAGPDDVAEMARQLGRHGPGDRVGYEHDSRRVAADPRKR